MSFGATIFGETGGCISTDDGVNVAKAYGATVLGESCGVAPELPEDFASAENGDDKTRLAFYREARATLQALVTLAGKQAWPSDLPVMQMLRSALERADHIVAPDPRRWGLCTCGTDLSHSTVGDDGR